MFQVGNKQYSFTDPTVKLTSSLSPPSKSESTYHTSFKYKNLLYNFTWPTTFTYLQLSTKTQKNDYHQCNVSLKPDPESLTGFNLSNYSACFGSALLNNELYLLVSKTSPKPQSSPTSETLKINITTGVYFHVATSGETPTFRTSPLIHSISNMYILLQGGIDPQTNLPCDDAYALMFYEWVKLKTINPITPRTHFASTAINSKIYLQGGHLFKDQPKQSKSPTLSFQLYELKLSDIKKQLTFEPILPQSGPSPSPRSNHKMTSISSRYLLIFGGNIQEKNNQGENHNVSARDLWAFDLLQRKWIQIHFDMEKFVINSLFNLAIHLNELYIFGAFQTLKYNKKYETIKLEFLQQNDLKTVTNFNYQTSCKPKQNLEGFNIQLSTSLIHSTSYLIKFPFQAIQRIIEFAESKNSTMVRIYHELTTKTVEKYVNILIDIKTPGDMEVEADFEADVKKLFVYCLRMGKTALYIQTFQEKRQRRVHLMSSDGKYTPLLQRLQLFYSYTERMSDSSILSVQDVRNKDIIHRILESLIDDPQATIRSVEGGKIIIFVPNIIPTSKNYFYELIFDSPHDINFFRNNKKLQFFDKIHGDLMNLMEHSLQSYIKYSNTNKGTDIELKTQIFLNKLQSPVTQQQSYSNYLEEFYKHGKIVKVKFPTNTHLKHVESYSLYVCQDNFFLPQNNGILLYQNDRLVNRYECPFGQLFHDHFYQKKVSNEPRNVFKVMGEIHLSKNLPLINFNTEFQKTNKFTQFQLSFETAITNFISKMEPVARVPRLSSREARNHSHLHQNQIVVERENPEGHEGHEGDENGEIGVEGDLHFSGKLQEVEFKESGSHKRMKMDEEIFELKENQ